MSDIDSNVADMNRLLKVYETFDAESQTAKVLDAEIDRLADAIDAEVERTLWMPMPLEADWLDQVDPRDPQSRTHRETAAARIAAKSVSEEVEALASRQVTGEASYWSRFMPAHSNAKLDFDGMTGDNQQAVCEGIRWVLASLTAAGRLIPAGGMALTAEQVEDVEALVATANPYSAPADRLRALFPATEPAEPAASEGVNCGANSVVLGWCTLSAQHEGLHTNGTYFWGQAPAPAEPAEEETKAEDGSGWHWVQSAGGYYSGPACTGGYRCRSMAHYEGCLRPSLPASSPVVPAPTETGPKGTAAELREFAQNLITDIENREPWTADQIAEHIEEHFQ